MLADNVDIILPTHCRPHTVGCSIQSVIAQTHENFRLHVIGDGCDTATEAVIRSFADPRIVFHRFPKGFGFGYTHRNVVLRQTTSPFIAYATDDDLWLPDHLECGLHRLKKDHLSLVAFRSCHVRFPDTLDPYFFAFDWKMGRLTETLRNWFIGSVTCVHRRGVFENVGYWNDRLFRFGDREFYNRVRLSGEPFQYVDQITVLRFYAQHWDTRYALLKAPPQEHYLRKIQEPTWCKAIREETRPGSRSWRIRKEQWRDFFRFAVRSGPKFARFWYQKLIDQGNL